MEVRIVETLRKTEYGFEAQIREENEKKQRELEQRPEFQKWKNRALFYDIQSRARRSAQKS
jgi:hypothetical protein